MINRKFLDKDFVEQKNSHLNLKTARIPRLYFILMDDNLT